MGQLLDVRWAERCPALVIQTKDGKQKYKPCGKLAKVEERWCKEHGYKADIMRIGEKAKFPECSVNAHWTVGEGWDEWFAFALIATEERYQQLRPTLIQIGYGARTNFLLPSHVHWMQEMRAGWERAELERLSWEAEGEGETFGERRLILLSREQPTHECYRCGCLEWEHVTDLNNWFCANRDNHDNPGKGRQ